MLNYSLKKCDVNWAARATCTKSLAQSASPAQDCLYWHIISLLYCSSSKHCVSAADLCPLHSVFSYLLCSCSLLPSPEHSIPSASTKYYLCYVDHKSRFSPFCIHCLHSPHDLWFHSEVDCYWIGSWLVL